jgi:hypothetical protein
MTGARPDWRDLLLGLFLAALAGGALFVNRKLAIGTAADMGPGYMPRAVALGLLGFGLYFIVNGFRRAAEAIEPMQIRPILAVLAAVGFFALFAERLGLAITAAITVAIASLATRESRLVETAIFAIGLTALAALLFIKVLALPVPLWPR